MKNSYFFLIILSSLSFFCSKTGEDSIVLIPNNYEGFVFIMYEQKDYQELAYENGKRVYNIPHSGILKTSSLPNYGEQKHDF